MADIDQELLKRTKELDAMFDTAVAKLDVKSDLRVFFTRSHGYITKKIGTHIALFKNPNSLMRLNDSFAAVYLDAINGAPHQGWQQAFRVCGALDQHAVHAKGLLATLFLFPYSKTALETCAGCMAKVHISQDLRNALVQVKDVDPEDYGNVLVFVLEGHIYAEVKSRGRAGGSAMFMISVPFMDMLQTNAKIWRNEAYEQVYKKQVPDPSSAFLEAYHKAENR